MVNGFIQYETLAANVGCYTYSKLIITIANHTVIVRYVRIGPETVTVFNEKGEMLG